MRDKKQESLFKPEYRGGVTGGSGYNFQDAFIVSHLPHWMAKPDFRSFIKEGLDDVDVLFGDGESASTWHYQLKDHQVSLSEFKQVMSRFAKMAKRSDVNSTRFILGSCGLAPKVHSLWGLISEYRGLAKAHREKTLVSTKEEILAKMRALGLATYSELLLNELEVDCDYAGLRDTETAALMERFRGKFISLPFYVKESAEIIDEIFTKLALRVNKAIRVGITRDELQALIITELARAKKGPASVVYLHGWIRQAYEIEADFEIDWTAHFDHARLRVPSPETWEHELIPELRRLRQEFDKAGRKRTIWLRSRAPLSAGLAFGHTFAEAAGYNIQIEQPSPGAAQPVQYWQTDTEVNAEMALKIEEEAGDSKSTDAIVAIGVTDDPRPKIESYLSQVDLSASSRLYIAPGSGPSETSLNTESVIAFARAAKAAVRTFCNTHQPQRIHLFYFGPLGFAVLLGQKLNGLADIQCYERNKTTGYTPSCLLPA